MRNAKPLAFAAFLLGTTALIDPATAQNVINVNGLDATNSDNVSVNATFGELQTIGDATGLAGVYGILNTIGASATGALATASVNQTLSWSSAAGGSNVMPGNTVAVTGTITATNNTTVTPIAPATANIEADVAISPGFALIGSAAGATTGGGMGNTIGATATGAAAEASIVQSLANDPYAGSLDLTMLAANAVTATGVPITAVSVSASVLATLNPGSSGEINDGIGNTISAQAIGASAAASISTRQLDTTTASTAGSATASTNTVTTGKLLAGNQSAVTATAFDNSSTATIDNGIGNMIGASATGAGAGAAIGQAVLFTATPSATSNQVALSTLYGNTVSTSSIAALNDTTMVYASIGDTTPMISGSPVTATIANGLGNSISAQAIGASAGASITQQFENVTFATAPTGFGTVPATNSISTGYLSAGNIGTVSAFTGAVTPTISTGVGNSITASAVGAAAGIGVTQLLYNDIFTASAPLGSNTVASTSDSGITAINGNPATPGPAIASPVQATFEVSSGAITNEYGVGNVIGASAVGASASAAINQSILGSPLGTSSGDLTVLESNSVTVTAAAPASSALSATNTGASPVTATVNQGTDGATLEQSVGSTFSAQAIGATVSASITLHAYNTTISTISGSAVATNIVNTTGGVAGGGTGDLVASNNGTITASLTTASFDLIGAGTTNFLGASAIGAAAEASISQTAADKQNSVGVTLPELQVATLSLPANSVTTGALSATNSGSVASQIVLTGTFIGIGLNAEQLGVGNSIAAQAVGASANASISSQMYALFNSIVPSAPTTPATNTVTVTTITATNSGAVVAAADFRSGEPLSEAGFGDGVSGIGNFIGASAAGASAGTSVTQTVSGSGRTANFDMSQLPGNAVQAGAVVASNTGSVTASLAGPDELDLALAPGPAAGFVGNSFSAQAVGASTGASIAAQVFDTSFLTATAPLSTNTVSTASLSSTNSGPVTATATFGTAGTIAAPALIGGGIGGSIGASATGAASLASINQVVDFSNGGSVGSLAALNTLPVNSVTTGPIQAINNAGGTTTASITMVGTGFGGTGNTIHGGVGNSITATAIGASAGASIAQTVSLFH